MSESMLRAYDADKQRAFVGLLARQVVTPWSDQSLYTLVHRHAHVLATWASRLGYRLAHIDQCYRLRRVPVDGAVAAPVAPPPSRSVLLLSLYSAACLDDHREDSITLQELSDVVHLSTAGLGRWPYEPDLRAHRRELVKAVDLLVDHGVLERRTEDQLVDGWERRGEGIGAGYVLHRDALTLLIDTGDVDLALAQRAGSEGDNRGLRLLRLLLETQSILVDELPQPERDYLVGQRTRLVSLAEEMTGGTVESRADAITLVLPSDRDLPASVQLDFPSATAEDWVALRLLDDAARESSGAYRRCSRSNLEALAAQVHKSHRNILTKALQSSPGALVAAASARLEDLGLLRVLANGDWELTPTAGRFRDAELQQPRTITDSLFPEEE